MARPRKARNVISARIGSASPTSARAATAGSASRRRGRSRCRSRQSASPARDARRRSARPVAPRLLKVAITLRRRSMIGGDRVGDADAADQQRGEADQGQELAQALQRARHLRRGIAPVGDGEASLGQLCLAGIAERDEAASACRRRRRASRHSASGPGCRDRRGRSRQRVDRDHHARAERQPVGDLVGLGLDDGADRDLESCRAERSPSLSLQPLEQDRDRRRRRARKRGRRPSAGAVRRTVARPADRRRRRLSARPAPAPRRRDAAPWRAASRSR